MRKQDHALSSAPSVCPKALYSVGVTPSRNLLFLAPLGIPTLIIADDPQLIAAAGAAYAHWWAEPPRSKPRIELRLEIGGASSSADVSPDILVQGSRLKLRARGADGSANAATLKGSATLSRALVEDLTGLAEIIDTLLLFLLARDGRTPLHASGFMVDDLAILLAGPSGSGKSRLALAASDRGFPVLSDDMLFVQSEPSLTLWGFPRPVHVFKSDAPPGDHPARLRNGKLKVAVPLKGAALKADQAVLILLRHGKKLSIRKVAATEAIERLMQLEAGFDLLEDESRAAFEMLASTGAWQLSLTDDPDAAINLVASRFRAQARISGG